MPSMARTYVLGLDLLRLGAALLVMLYHFAFWDWLEGQPFGDVGPRQNVTQGMMVHFGWVGVEVFFVISGFVIAYTASTSQPAAFLKSRFLRLAPANWIAATLVLLILWLLGERESNVLALTYVQTMVFWPLDAIDGVWWTLGIEINFYLLVFYLLRRNRLESLERIMVAIGFASGLFWIVALSLQSTLQGTSGVWATLHRLVLKVEGNRELQLLLVQHGCLFAVGTLLWQIADRGMTIRRAAALGGLIGCCLLEIVGQNGIIGRTAHQSLSPVPALLVWLTAVVILAASVRFNATFVRLAGHAAGPVRFVGRATYPLYLVHSAVGIGVVKTLYPRLGTSAVLVAFAASLGCAAVIAHFLEPGLRRSVASFWPKNDATRPSAHAAL